MLKHSLIIILLVNITLAQDALQNNKNINESGSENNDVNYSKSSLIDESNRMVKYNPEIYKDGRIDNLKFRFYQSEKSKEKNSFDLVSSVGSNINFGGLWEKYAVVNFTPQLFIRPAGFISIYANRYLNCLIPLEAIKDYSQSMILQSLAVLAVDNSMKIFFNINGNWIAEVISFTAKNLLINILIKPAISNSANSPSPVLQYENYYYSMSISF